MIAPLRRLVRDVAPLRAVVVPVLALGVRPDVAGEWVACVMYHGMEAADRARFAAQLRYMRRFAEFVGVDDAVGLLRRERPGGRYVCVTFDDGEWGAYAHAHPVLAEAGVPAAFFVVPAWIDREGRDTAGSRTRLTWQECRELAAAGVTIGSHSLTHARLADLGADRAREEVELSRSRIEAEVGRACRHFACPWGQPGEDYLPDRDPARAREAGYDSFLTTIRGRATAGTSPWAIPRIRLEPSWSTRQLRYALFR